MQLLEVKIPNDILICLIWITSIFVRPTRKINMQNFPLFYVQNCRIICAYTANHTIIPVCEFFKSPAMITARFSALPQVTGVDVFPLRIYLGKSWNRFSRTADKVRGARKPKNGVRARDTVSLRKHNNYYNYRRLHLIWQPPTETIRPESRDPYRRERLGRKIAKKSKCPVLRRHPVLLQHQVDGYLFYL